MWSGYILEQHHRAFLNFPFPYSDMRYMWVLFGLFFHVLQLLTIQLTTRKLVLHWQMYDGSISNQWTKNSDLP